MATPKKYYSVEFGSIDLSSCRLCGIIVDQHYCKNLFNKKNQELLEIVHQILGSVLQCDSALPKLLCRSCEHKVRNTGILRKSITNTQELLAKKKTRAKRCVDVSRSSTQLQQKTRSKLVVNIQDGKPSPKTSEKKPWILWNRSIRPNGKFKVQVNVFQFQRLSYTYLYVLQWGKFKF